MKLKLLIIAFVMQICCIASVHTPFKYDLSIVAIFQDEAPYLTEWIEYHKVVGVEHFYLYNNNSQDNYKEKLQPYIDQGLVELIEWPSIRQKNEWHDFTFKTQPGAYNDAMEKSRNISKWVAAIDTDEFIITASGKPIIEELEPKYTCVSGLFINWQCFGTSGIRCEPDEDGNVFITHKLLKKMDKYNHWNGNGKLIVQPLHVKNWWYPHDATMLEGHWSVNTDYVPTSCSAPYVQNNVLYLNHYWARDLNFFENVKLKRYAKWNGTQEADCRQREAVMNVEFDDAILHVIGWE